MIRISKGLQASHGACLVYSPNIDSQPSLRVTFDQVAIHNYSCQEVKQNSQFPLVSTDFKKLLFKDQFQELKNYATTKITLQFFKQNNKLSVF